LDDRIFAENVLEYVVVQCKGKEADELMDVMLGVLGQMKEHKFEKMAKELGIFNQPMTKVEKPAKKPAKKIKKLKKKGTNKSVKKKE